MNNIPEKKLRIILAILGVCMILATAADNVLSYLERQESQTTAVSDKPEQTSAPAETKAAVETAAQTETEAQTESQISYYATDEEIMALNIEELRNSPAAGSTKEENNIIYYVDDLGKEVACAYAGFPDEYTVEIIKNCPTELGIKVSDSEFITCYNIATSVGLDFCKKLKLDASEDAYELELAENVIMIRVPDHSQMDALLIANDDGTVITCNISSSIESQKISEIDLIAELLKDIKFE